MRVMATRYNADPAVASRPFDRGRDGFVLGEGAWMMVLEREEDARRGRTIYAFVEGYGSTCDAYHRVQMDPDGTEIIRAMTLALERSGRREGRDRLRQLSRHVDAAERRDRGRVRQAAVRRSRGAAAGVVDQVDGRPPAGRERRLRHRDDGAGARAEVPAADDQSGGGGSGLRPRLHSECRAGRRRRGPRCATCLGFGSKNSAIVLGAAGVTGKSKALTPTLPRRGLHSYWRPAPCVDFAIAGTAAR